MEGAILVQITVPLAIAAIVIGATKSERRFNRMDYFGRIAGIFIGGAIIMILFLMIDSTVLIAIAVVAALIAGIFGWHWMVLRTNDIGWNKWINLAALVPAVGVIYAIALFFIPGKPAQEAPTSDDPFDSTSSD